MPTKTMGTVFSLTPEGGERTQIGYLTSIGEIACDSEMIDVTTLDRQDGCRVYMQGVRDAGEMRLTGFHRKDEGGQALVRTLYNSGKEAAARIDFADGTAFEFPVLIKGWSLGASQVDGAVSFACTLRLNGAVESVSA